MSSPEPPYKILFTSDARDDVGSLDGCIRKRLKGVLTNKLARDPEAYGTPLRSPLAGFWKHEFASHRVIYRIYPDKAIIVVCAVGKRQGEHAGDVYKQLEALVKAGKTAEQIIAVIKSTARRSRNQRRATAILAVLGHGRDARGTRSRRKREFLVKKTRIYGIAMQNPSPNLVSFSQYFKIE